MAKDKNEPTQGPFKVKYQILGRKPETRNVKIPTPLADKAEQDAAIKKVLAGEYKVPVTGVKVLPQSEKVEPIAFEGTDASEGENKKGPMTVEKVRAMKKPELIEFAAASEFDLGEDPKGLDEDELRNLVALYFEDRQKGLEDKQ